MSITIVLAEDHHVVRQGVRSLLEKEDLFNVIGESNEGPQAIKMVQQMKPDVLVLDWMMQGLSGAETIQRVREVSPETKVIVLSMYDMEAYVLEALKSGASGYVLKSSHADELIHAIREVVAGRTYLSAPFSQRAIEAYSRKTQDTGNDPYQSLTPRQREVLHLSAEGMTVAEIAEKLFLSPRTVEGHRANLMKKLNLNNQTELVRYAIWRGIISVD
jgi:DNA-binding NarL/FixJ family response regulator